jgi:hypothetical protein
MPLLCFLQYIFLLLLSINKISIDLCPPPQDHLILYFSVVSGLLTRGHYLNHWNCNYNRENYLSPWFCIPHGFYLGRERTRELLVCWLTETFRVRGTLYESLVSWIRLVFYLSHAWAPERVWDSKWNFFHECFGRERNSLCKTIFSAWISGGRNSTRGSLKGWSCYN